MNKKPNEQQEELKALRKRNLELEKTISEYQTMLNNSPQGYILIERNFQIRSFNQLATHNAQVVLGVELIVSNLIIDIIPEDDLADFKKYFSLALSGTSASEERHFYGTDGNEYWFLHSYYPVRAENEINAVCLGILDITDRKQMEESLRDEQKRLSVIYNSTTDSQVMFAVEPDGKFRLVNVNQAYIETLNVYGLSFTRENLEGKTLRELANLFRLPETIVFETLAHYRQAAQTGVPVKYDESIRAAGKVFYSEITLVPILGEQNSCQYILYNSHNITDRIRAEQETNENKEKFVSIFEMSPDAILLAEATTGIIVDANPAAAKLFEKPVQAIVGMHQGELHPQDELEKSREAFAYRSPASEIDPPPIEIDILTAQNKRKSVEIRGSVIQIKGKDFILGNFRDISERKQAENALKESQANLLAILESTDDLISARDREGRLIYFNQASENMIKRLFNVEASVGLNTLEYLPENEQKKWRKILANVLSGEKYQGGFFWKFKEGDVRYYDIAFNPIRKDHEIIGSVEFNRDITDRKETEEALRTSEERFNLAIQGTRDGLCDWNLVTDDFYYSEQFAEILGYKRGELPENSEACFGLIHPDDKERVTQAMQDYLENGEKIFEKTFRMRTKSGEFCWTTCRGAAVRDDSGKPCRFIGFLSDITERKNMEEQLRQTQKMEAIGKLAGGIAHDFNNLLTVINGYADILLAEMASSQSEFDDLQQIKRAGTRAASLTAQLLAFSRKQILQLEIFNINELLNNLECMLRRLIGEDIEFVTYLERGLADVKADRGQIEQIIVNLAINARDAMPRGGKITIRTQNIYLNEAYVKKHANIKPGPYILISMTDNGFGIAPQTLEHIFEPFFTTKAVGKGTGLGLSTVYGIVAQSGGNIYAQSQPGKGTTFNIHLPAITSTQILESQNQEQHRNWVGSETILIVEDEKSVLSLVQKTLQRMGYDLIVAGDGRDAIKAIKNYKKPIHLLLTDVVMPNMSGKVLAEKIRKLQPDTKVCFMSGYTNDAIISHGVLDGQVHFIQKPFSPEILARRVREILDEK